MTTITQMEMNAEQIVFAAKIAARLGFTQTAYTSSSALVGLFCLPDRASQRSGCVVLTREFGFLFVADLEDMHLYDLLSSKVESADGDRMMLGRGRT